MSKRNPWLRPAGSDGLIPVVVLWNQFASLYGNDWRVLFPDDAAKIAWQEEAAALFYERGIRYTMVSTAMNTLRAEVRAGSVPLGLAAFADRCLPVFDFEGAFYEAARESVRTGHGTAVWSHPAIYWAARDYGFTRIQSIKWSRIKGEWVRLLAARLQSPCPAIPPKQEEPVYRRGDAQLASATVSALRAQLAARAG
ncbi:hypothetical protein [Silvimonas sp.]|uniref:hypothetical protein n=1 Tax=Silvimonas sp. TaxID=2650811 RepID=UPI00283B2832|nr:hypothetical protein [Silvimonas sp.]MDR3427957.1 hypothetical protein [Silvimonas sp.]